MVYKAIIASKNIIDVQQDIKTDIYIYIIGSKTLILYKTIIADKTLILYMIVIVRKNLIYNHYSNHSKLLYYICRYLLTFDNQSQQGGCTFIIYDHYGKQHSYIIYGHYINQDCCNNYIIYVILLTVISSSNVVIQSY